jgi:hypothetical protein
MERLFSPCNRLHDILEIQGRPLQYDGRPHLFRELNLDVSTEELLSAERAFTYADLYALLGNEYTVLWLTPHASFVRANASRELLLSYYERNDYRFRFIVDDQSISAVARSSAALAEIADVVRRLLLANASEVHVVDLGSTGRSGECFFDAFSFANLVEQCQNLKSLTLGTLKVTLSEDHIRALGTISRPDLDIELTHCRITGAAAAVLAQVMERSEGPTKLYWCDIDYHVLAEGLRGNSRLKSLFPRLSPYRGGADQELLVIAGALRENKGLIDLEVQWNPWDVICDSLKTHPTLEVLSFQSGFLPWAPAMLEPRIQVLVDMLKVNMSIHTIPDVEQYREHELFRESVFPYLKTNRLRPHLLAIQRTRPIAYRAKVLGRALLYTRTDANSFWMLLSGNAEVAFPSTTLTTTRAANLPMPTATAATTSNAVAVATTAVITITATRASSTTVACAAANVATPTTCQKSKARP